MMSKFEKFLLSSLCNLKPSSRLACAGLPLAMQNLLSAPLTTTQPFYLWSAPIVRKSFPAGGERSFCVSCGGLRAPRDDLWPIQPSS